ncbi:hypothetical protein [Streptomyces corynorhini]|uniref:Uncharacterized protein n=1 Tax=Streptomyces corynorhini TaxID=2282652 RepID=A0A370B5T1_9ACTN|nr:hypothetical protein [Streptomyces corynorhini]RDG36022.1 hypothetical protein DVH02_22245 [Streptomyces corynorhini]
MEQRIDPKIQPEFAVGTDPAYIPGLTAPRTGAAGTATEKKTDPAVEPEPEATVPDDAATAADAAPEAEPEGKKESEEPEEPEEPEKPEDSEDSGTTEQEAGAEAATAAEAETADGPEFEAADRRGSITADRDGIRFRLDEEEADFRWDEIGAVEIATLRFPRRFTVTVHVSDRRWFTAEVETTAKSSLQEWTAGFDKVLDAYFEES